MAEASEATQSSGTYVLYNVTTGRNMLPDPYNNYSPEHGVLNNYRDHSDLAKFIQSNKDEFSNIGIEYVPKGLHFYIERKSDGTENVIHVHPGDLVMEQKLTKLADEYHATSK